MGDITGQYSSSLVVLLLCGDGSFYIVLTFVPCGDRVYCTGGSSCGDWFGIGETETGLVLSLLVVVVTTFRTTSDWVWVRCGDGSFCTVLTPIPCGNRGYCTVGPSCGDWLCTGEAGLVLSVLSVVVTDHI